MTAQIVRLLCQTPPGVWELVDASGPMRAGDVVLRGADGSPVSYARPATPSAHESTSAPRRSVLPPRALFRHS